METALLPELPQLPAQESGALAPLPDDPSMGRMAPLHLQPQGASPPPTGPGVVAPPAPAPEPSGLSRTMTGLGLLGAAAAGAAGYAVSRSAWGVGAGILYYGAARNAVRTCRLLGSDTPEATKSGTVALFGLLGAGYLTYRSIDRGDSE